MLKLLFEVVSKSMHISDFEITIWNIVNNFFHVGFNAKFTKQKFQEIEFYIILVKQSSKSANRSRINGNKYVP